MRQRMTDWIVDPQQLSFEILEPRADGRYAHALGASAGRLESVPGCEDLSLHPDALWAEIEPFETSGDADGDAVP